MSISKVPYPAKMLRIGRLKKVHDAEREIGQIMSIKNNEKEYNSPEHIKQMRELELERKRLRKSISKFTLEELLLIRLYDDIMENPDKFYEIVPTEAMFYFSDKIKDIKKIGIFEHLKTFEEYYLHDTYLNRSNEVKEILSNFNLKYQIYDENPVLKIVFPYANSTYGGRWVDMEYNLIESFLKELLRYEFVYKVDETEETTTILVEC